jgi:hypothetical protein
MHPNCSELDLAYADFWPFGLLKAAQWVRINLRVFIVIVSRRPIVTFGYFVLLKLSDFANYGSGNFPLWGIFPIQWLLFTLPNPDGHNFWLLLSPLAPLCP